MLSMAEKIAKPKEIKGLDLSLAGFDLSFHFFNNIVTVDS